jgi:hypothetical protein
MINEKDFTKPKNKGKKPKLFLVLDCETATLPFIKQWELSAKDKQKISIAKPLVYDLAWQIVDRKGNIYSRHSFLIQETFFVPQIFNTAYYAWKRPLYMERFEKEEIICKTWNDAINILLEDCKQCEGVYAFNAMFDFKKAIPFTQNYITNLYSSTYQQWENKQYKICQNILKKGKSAGKLEDLYNFNLYEENFPMFDLWRLACLKLINEKKYKQNCISNGLISKSGLFFKTSAETTYQYLTDNYNFEEEHTALSDVQAETEILLKILRRVKNLNEIEQGIDAPPFQQLGTTTDFIQSCPKKGKNKIKQADIESILDILAEDYESRASDIGNSFATRQAKEYFKLENFKEQIYPNTLNKKRATDIKLSEINRAFDKIENYLRINSANLSESTRDKKSEQLQELDNLLCHYAEIKYKK